MTNTIKRPKSKIKDLNEVRSLIYSGKFAVAKQRLDELAKIFSEEDCGIVRLRILLYFS